MAANLQGILIVVLAVIVGIFVGVGLGYLWMQGRIDRQAATLKAQQQQLDDLEAAYEVRLRDTTQQLRQEYEAELATTIAHYQDQLAAKTTELQRTYETRLQVLQQGLTSSLAERSAVAPATSVAATASEQYDSEATPNDSDTAPVVKPQKDLQAQVAQIKRQYEARLKEAAQKLQSTYKHKLVEEATTVKAQLQVEYNRRLAEKVEAYEAQFKIRKAELEEEYTSRQALLDQQEALISGIQTGLTPSAIMGTGDETTVTMPPVARPPVTFMAEEPLIANPTGQADVPPVAIPEVTQLTDHEAELTAMVEPYSPPSTTNSPAIEPAIASKRSEMLDRSTNEEETSMRSPFPPAAPLVTPTPAPADAPADVPADAPANTEGEEGFDPLDLSDFD